MSNYLTQLHRQNQPLFFAALALASIAPMGLSFFAPNNSADPIDAMGVAKYFLALIIAPFFETLTFQYLPALFCKRKRITSWKLTLIMVIPFIMAHFSTPLNTVRLVNASAGAVVLGICFWTGLERSYYYAFVTTTALHAFHNAIALVLNEMLS